MKKNLRFVLFITSNHVIRMIVSTFPHFLSFLLMLHSMYIIVDGTSPNGLTLYLN